MVLNSSGVTVAKGREVVGHGRQGFGGDCFGYVCIL